MHSSMIIRFLLATLIAYQTSIVSFFTECPECHVIPLSLDTGDHYLSLSNVFIHPGDHAPSAVNSACLFIGGDLGVCTDSVTKSLEKDDWVTTYSLLANHWQGKYQLSRHVMLTVLSRLRKYASPRRLLVFGANEAEAVLWNNVNNLGSRGFTRFINRSVSSIRPDVGNPVVGISHEIEVQLNLIDLSGADTKGVLGNYSYSPWDVILLQDICRDEEDRFLTHNCSFRPFHKRAAMSGGPCSSKAFCTQTYVDYAMQLVSDSGYVFIHSHSLISSGNERENHALLVTDFSGLENKFTYRNVLSAHADDTGSKVVYYSSQEAGERTIAGGRGNTLSDSADDIKEFTQCMATAFISNYTNSTSSDEFSRADFWNSLYSSGFTRVVGVLFCCRRRYTDILLPYLQSQLVINGGVIDHVLVYNFGSEPGDEGHPDEVAALPGFKLGSSCPSKLFVCAYENLGVVDPAALFVKLDDDLLFLAEQTVEFLVWDKLHAPPGSIVHGNGVNHMHTPFFHALLAKLQDDGRSDEDGHSQCDSSRGHCGTTAMEEKSNPFVPLFPDLSQVDYLRQPGYRWKSHTYAAAFNYAFYGFDWTSAAAANAQHYLFLSLMKGHFSNEDINDINDTSRMSLRLARALASRAPISRKTNASDASLLRQRAKAYWFPQPLDLNTCSCRRPQTGYGYCSPSGYYRTSINLVAFSWRDIADHMDLIRQTSDEFALTIHIPERGGGRQIVSGRALYVHAAFTPQRLDHNIQLREAEILKEYKGLADIYFS